MEWIILGVAISWPVIYTLFETGELKASIEAARARLDQQNCRIQELQNLLPPNSLSDAAPAAPGLSAKIAPLADIRSTRQAATRPSWQKAKAQLEARSMEETNAD